LTPIALPIAFIGPHRRAHLLCNAVAVCRKSYIHPEVLALLLKTKPMSAAAKAAQPKRKACLTISECAFLSFLRAHE